MNAPVVLTIAASDSGGAAGAAADLTTFAALGAHGACVLTAVTAQDTTGVGDVHLVPLTSIEAQLDAVLEDLPVAAIKTGMLGTAEVVRLLAKRLKGRLLVVDPVLVATSGAILGDDAVLAAYADHLLPIATVITPNLDEARALLGLEDSPSILARKLASLGPAVVLTGGDRAGTCTDWVALSGSEPVPLRHPAVETDNDHGTGCTFSSALAVHLGQGMRLRPAARRAAAYTTQQLELSRSWTLGRGRGPIAHTVPPNRPIGGIS